MNIKYILILLGLGGSLLAGTVKPDFRTLYINDVSNIAACVSPYHKEGEGISDKMIAASIDETFYGPAAGCVDVHMLQPCFTWVPWWKSKIYPADEHYKWYYEVTGFPYNQLGIEKYMLDGGDMMAVFTAECRKLGISPFVSFRLNDHHYKEYADIIAEIIGGSSEYKGMNFGNGLPGPESCISKFHLDNRQWWVGPEPTVPAEGRLAFLHNQNYRSQLRNARSMDWSQPQVREHIFLFINELCLNYDIDGLELDFMRHSPFFKYDTDLSYSQRENIMLDFTARVRKALDMGAKQGQRRWLSVRVPFRINEHKEMGVNLPVLVEAGVDMVNLSCNYCTEQQCDVAKICQMIPDTPVFLEITHTTQTIKTEPEKIAFRQSEQFSIHRLITDEQIYTLANLAYRRGAQGISAFNFVYHRYFQERKTGIGCEPPFHVFRIIKDRDLTARQRQNYFLSIRDYDGTNIRTTYKADLEKTLKLDMAPPQGGWRRDGRLRLQKKSGDFIGMELSFNGHKLSPTEDVSEFYPVSNPDGLGKAEDLRAWVIPYGIVKDGVNDLAVKAGKDIEINYIDIGIE